MKRVPKHEPNSSYFHLVGCIVDFMLRCGEENHLMHDVHGVHDGYEEEMAPSSDVNDTDEDESKISIVHKPFDEPSSENLYMDVSESECNIVNKTLSQNNSSDLPATVIIELNYNEHIEHSLTINECSICSL